MYTYVEVRTETDKHRLKRKGLRQVGLTQVQLHSLSLFYFAFYKNW